MRVSAQVSSLQSVFPSLNKQNIFFFFIDHLSISLGSSERGVTSFCLQKFLQVIHATGMVSIHAYTSNQSIDCARLHQSCTYILHRFDGSDLCAKKKQAIKTSRTHLTSSWRNWFSEFLKDRCQALSRPLWICSSFSPRRPLLSWHSFYKCVRRWFLYISNKEKVHKIQLKFS